MPRGSGASPGWPAGPGGRRRGVTPWPSPSRIPASFVSPRAARDGFAGPGAGPAPRRQAAPDDPPPARPRLARSLGPLRQEPRRGDRRAAARGRDAARQARPPHLRGRVGVVLRDAPLQAGGDGRPAGGGPGPVLQPDLFGVRRHGRREPPGRSVPPRGLRARGLRRSQRGTRAPQPRKPRGCWPWRLPRCQRAGETATPRREARTLDCPSSGAPQKPWTSVRVMFTRAAIGLVGALLVSSVATAAQYRLRVVALAGAPSPAGGSFDRFSLERVPVVTPVNG